MIKPGMKLAEAIIQLTRGFRKFTGRDPDGLEKIKIKQEASQRIKDLEKVVDMEGNVIDTSKGIMGGKQIQESPEFGKIIKEVKTKGLSDKDFRSEKTSFRSNIAKNSPEFNQQLVDKIIKREIFQDLSDAQRKEFLDNLDFVLKNPRDGSAEGGRIGLKEGNGKDDSLTGITMTIEERMKRIRKLMEELEKAKKGIGIDPDPEDDLGGGGDFGSFKDFIENAAGATGDFELLDLYDDFLKTGDDSKIMLRLKSLGYDMTDNFAAGGIAGMLGE